jgi:uncharacterized protein (UPF0264 family)
MTRLLVSVRDAVEAQAVVAGGGDVVDVKEPAAGSLGRAPAAVWRSVLAAVAGAVPVSVALGELSEATSLPSLPAGVSWAKVGLAGEAERTDWPRRLERIAEQLRPVPLVVAAYADGRRAQAPSLEAILEFVIGANISTLLIDTWQKDERRLLDWLPLGEIAALQARLPAGTALALAGRLRLTDLPRLMPLQPELLAVRGLACSGSQRLAVVQARRVAVLQRRLARLRAAAPAMSLAGRRP